MQLAEGRPLAEQLGINPDRPDSFAFVANGQAYVKSEAVLRIARELPRWQWTWLFHFIPRVIRDEIYDWSHATAIAGSAVVTLASCRIQIVRGDREPPRDCGTMAPVAGWLRTGMTKEAPLPARRWPRSALKSAPITSDKQATLLNDRNPLSRALV